MTDPTKPPTPPLHIDVPGYTGPERRHEFRLWREKIERRLGDGADTMKELRTELEANTTATKAVQAETAELVVWLKSLKGAFAVFDVIGKVAKPVGAIAGALVALWVLFLTATGKAPK